jgi:HAD superfamily hydrolase (TIGR01509 family)
MIIKGVVLDYDGVVLDSFRGGLRKIHALCSMHEIPFGRQERTKLTEVWGLPGIELLQMGLGVSHELAVRLNQQWIRWDNEQPPELVPGARNALLWLKLNGFHTCLLTSRHRQNVQVMLPAQDLDNKFAAVCTREDVTHHKPDPRALRPPIEQLQERFGIKQQECIFVGDTPSDIEAGHRAGVHTLVVQTGPYLLKHSDKTLGGKKVELANILPSIDELPLYIEENHEGPLTTSYI